MGKRINEYELSENVKPQDKVIGSAITDGKTYNYSIEDIVAMVQVKTGSVTGIKLYDIHESTTKDFSLIVNTAIPPYEFAPSEVGIFQVFNKDGKFSKLYMVNKSTPDIVRFGHGYDPIDIDDDLIVLRTHLDYNNPTLAVSPDTAPGFPVFSGNSPETYEIYFKKLVQGDGIEITDNADNLEIKSTIDTNIFMDNTVDDADILVFRGQDQQGYKFNVINFEGNVPVASDYSGFSVRFWDKELISANRTLSENENRKTIWIDSSVNVSITIPDTGLPDKFECAFVKAGSGNINFVKTGNITVFGNGTTMVELGGTAWLEMKPGDSSTFLLTGDLIV